MVESPEQPTREVLTSGGNRTTIVRSLPPTTGAESSGELVVVDIRHDSISPTNYDRHDGTPLRVLTSTAAKLDVSKRSHESMGFWHRNVDDTEVIVCVQGALRWETELGSHVLHEGQFLVIPRGIAHRSALDRESSTENILLEVKIAGDVSYTGPQEARVE